MPSPTSSTRPICSVSGPRRVAPSLIPARSSQPSASMSVSVVVIREVRKDLGEVGTPTVLDNKVRTVQLQASDQSGVLLEGNLGTGADRKSTRLNSSHQIISYAVF